MSRGELKPGDDVYVSIDGGEFPGQVLKVEKLSGYILCDIHTDWAWDHGHASPRVMPVQTVAARSGKVRPRTQEEATGD